MEWEAVLLVRAIKQNFLRCLALKKNQKLHTVVAFGYPSHTSKMEDAKDGNIKYYLDENKDYVVPKRKMEDIVKYL